MAAKKAVKKAGKPKKVRLLSGGNPQISIAAGSAPVQAYISAMPGWKQAIGRQVDSIVSKTAPAVVKAVKWNSPMYGMKETGWFLSVHCFNKFVRLTFFNGAKLKPMPPKESSQKLVRYYDVYEDKGLDEAALKNWIKQAVRIPGWGKV